MEKGHQYLTFYYNTFKFRLAKYKRRPLLCQWKRDINMRRCEQIIYIINRSEPGITGISLLRNPGYPGISLLRIGGFKCKLENQEHLPIICS